MEPNYDFNIEATEDSACPTNYKPNPARPPIEKSYYKSPKKVKSRSKNIKSRPEWISDIDTRKQSINSVISTVDLHETENQTFKTINPAKNMREPSKPPNNNRSSSLPSIALKSPSNNKKKEVDYSYLDQYKPPPQYMTNRERLELLRIKQEKEKNNNILKYEAKNSIAKEVNSNYSDSKNRSTYPSSKSYNAKSNYTPAPPSPKQPKKSSPKKTLRAEPSVSKEEPKKTYRSDKTLSKEDPSKIYSVPSKTKSNSLKLDVKSKSEPTSKSSSRHSSTSNNNFVDIHGLKSASLSVASSASNFSSRSKVITFNDKKQSLGSIGMTTITKVDNSFKVRQFPDGPKQGFATATSMIESDQWEKNIEVRDAEGSFGTLDLT